MPRVCRVCTTVGSSACWCATNHGDSSWDCSCRLIAGVLLELALQLLGSSSKYYWYLVLSVRKFCISSSLSSCKHLIKYKKHKKDVYCRYCRHLYVTYALSETFDDRPIVATVLPCPSIWRIAYVSTDADMQIRILARQYRSEYVETKKCLGAGNQGQVRVRSPSVQRRPHLLDLAPFLCVTLRLFSLGKIRPFRIEPPRRTVSCT